MTISIYEYTNDRGYIYHLLLLVYDMTTRNDFLCTDEEIKNILYPHKKIFFIGICVVSLIRWLLISIH